MQLLEYFYDRNNEITTYHQRKFSLSKGEKILLYGSPASGKSYLVLDYLMEFDPEEILYIDFRDPKFEFRDIMEEDVEGFVEANGIKVLVLDHYQHTYFETFPRVNQLILITNRDHAYEGFEKLNLPLLDYEEFFSFQKRGNERQVFNLFLRQGTLPQLATQTAPKEQLFFNFIRTHFSESEQKLLNVLAHFNGATVTTFQIYNYAKERYKISKDLIYRQIEDFKERGIILFVFDCKDVKKKKLLFFDFALAKYLTLTQTFPKQFETMIALSLHKHNISFKTFGNRGFLTEKNHLIVPAPFESKEFFFKKVAGKLLSYKKADLKKVYIITIPNHYEFTIENIEFEALPFYEWIVINDEN